MSFLDRSSGFKRTSPEDVVIKNQLESGGAVPTIQEGLQNPDAFPFLVREIQRMNRESPEDAGRFLDGLKKAETLLEQENITWSEVKETLIVGGVTFGGAFALAVATFILTGNPGLSELTAAGAGIGAKVGTTGAAVGSLISGWQRAGQRKEALQRVRALREAITPREKHEA